MSNVIQRFIDNDRFAGLIGAEIVEHRAGTAKARLELREEHLKSANTAHGGLIFSLADAVFSFAFNPRLTTYLIEVRDETEDLVASFQGTVYRKRDRLEDILSLKRLWVSLGRWRCPALNSI